MSKKTLDNTRTLDQIMTVTKRNPRNDVADRIKLCDKTFSRLAAKLLSEMAANKAARKLRRLYLSESPAYIKAVLNELRDVIYGRDNHNTDWWDAMMDEVGEDIEKLY